MESAQSAPPPGVGAGEGCGLFRSNELKLKFGILYSNLLVKISRFYTLVRVKLRGSYDGSVVWSGEGEEGEGNSVSLWHGLGCWHLLLGVASASPWPWPSSRSFATK